MNREDLPVEILDRELPKEEGKQHKMFYDEKVRNSGGFTSTLFLAGLIVVSFMWGMLVVIFLR